MYPSNSVHECGDKTPSIPGVPKLDNVNRLDLARGPGFGLLTTTFFRKQTWEITSHWRVINTVDAVSIIEKKSTAQMYRIVVFYILRLCSQHDLFCCCLTGSGSVILTGRKGEIQSSGYPTPYPADVRSSWEISVPKGFLVKLQITDLAITGETGVCNDDKLVITDAYSTLGECPVFFRALGP